jgi:uncharacterized protein YbgA (DUF1722 family)/uncharacterized protein YbbK (DUF523 family)
MEEKIRLGISTCLLGEKVRFDGGHKHDRFLTDTLGQYVEYVPVCPEVECGFGIPREAMRLIGNPKAPRLVTTHTNQDMTERMQAWAEKRVVELEKENLYGFVFKSGSPSSGMERVRVYNEKGMPVLQGVGLFARIFMEWFPLLPVEEDGRLNDPVLRENFIGRIFALKRWREVVASGQTRGNLVDFHTRHKLLLLSHSPKLYQAMGQLVAAQKGTSIKELFAQYEKLLMEALTLKTSARKHTNVLTHMMGYFKKELVADEKQELLEIIDQYHKGYVPLVVPVTLINHYVRKYKQPYLSNQSYLNPHPMELQLRNHA